LNHVSALEYELDVFDERLENVGFFKHYVQALRAERSLPGDVFERLARDTSEFGWGDALRVRLTSFIYAKASYEWALNLPRPDQVFGNGAQVVENLELAPERSHNANLSLTLDVDDSPAGGFDANVNVFLRDVENLIVLLGSDAVFSYHNVFAARTTGVEATTTWRSPGEYVEVGGNVTLLDMRNTSTTGTFGAFEGDRIPNRPYLSGNASLRVRQPGMASPRDELSAVWYLRYVHDFFRTWESVGRPALKATIESQLTHTLGLSYVFRRGSMEVGVSSEVENVAAAKVFDFFGIQRPGRAFHSRLTAGF
jgi:hypothetical protein